MTDVALARFLKYCAFDPLTGCVMWIGGTTAGRGHSQRYGAFWFERRRWYAHRWAAKHIHGQEINDMQVDHCCPHGPETLCVHHVQAVTPEANREYQWIRRQVGLLPQPPVGEIADDAVPFYYPPAWLEQKETPPSLSR
ncbi:MAG TPA: hypothetical protein VF638_14220 [Sphingomonas sp.]|jgi:hypothetical protein